MDVVPNHSIHGYSKYLGQCAMQSKMAGYQILVQFDRRQLLNENNGNRNSLFESPVKIILLISFGGMLTSLLLIVFKALISFESYCIVK